MVQEYDNNIVGEVTNVDSEEFVKRKFVKQKKSKLLEIQGGGGGFRNPFPCTPSS
jgi:hypothetical protein